ncbi:MAG: hypothetical protein CVT65_07420 [Actinobacteria bacterium HGW-Actinobacteria-5]|mgnify:FL=1|jgi:hypothetical protein|nr:MAG: hypothetical protein CVT65_07420 [Actinobacteria bacterium HGW-Actinobacteria-5]
MAEIRKFDPAAGNAIAQALKAAMGEPVRPNQPGERSSSHPQQPEPPATTSWVSLQVTRQEVTESEED